MFQDKYDWMFLHCSDREIWDDSLKRYNVYEFDDVDFDKYYTFNNIKDKNINFINTKLHNLYEDIFSKIYLQNKQGMYKNLTSKQKKHIIKKLNGFKNNTSNSIVEITVNVVNKIPQNLYSKNKHNNKFRPLTDNEKYNFVGELNAVKRMKDHFNKT